MYNKLKAEHDALLAERAANDSKPIKVTLPDGKQVDAESWKTTPYQIACGIRYDFVLWYTQSPSDTALRLQVVAVRVWIMYNFSPSRLSQLFLYIVNWR